MTNESDNQDQGDFLFGRRIVPIRREDNVVYARTLRRGEEDTGEAVHLEPGDRLVIPAGELVVDSRDIDEYYNPIGLGGYRTGSQYRLDMVSVRHGETGSLSLFILPCSEDGCCPCTVGVCH